MSNPYKAYQKNQAPDWLKGLDKYVVVPDDNEAVIRDVKTTVRNHGGDEKLMEKDAYVEGNK
jgi:hypothetical protein